MPVRMNGQEGLVTDHDDVAGTLSLPSDLTINLSGADKPNTRKNLITAAGGITGDPSGWVVKDESGNVISKAQFNVTGIRLTLSLERGMMLIIR